MDVKKLIEKLGLIPLPGEGGYYKSNFRSPDLINDAVLPDNCAAAKQLYSAIYYLLTPDTYSAMHRLPTDEIFHFYLGDPVKMLQLYPDGDSSINILGSDIFAGQLVQCLVPKFTWQGSMLIEGGKFALMGTTMSPAYENSDLELADHNILSKKYKRHNHLINQLKTHK